MPALELILQEHTEKLTFAVSQQYSCHMVAIGVPRNSLIDGEIPEELPSKAKGEWGEREGEALCYILDAM
jgi:hypothetical protein